MIETPTFFVITENGEEKLPSKDKLENCKTEGLTPVLYLDANICLDLVHYFNGSLKNASSQNNIRTLVTYVQANKIGVLPNLGVLELCVNKKNPQVDFNKYKEFINKIGYVFDTPIEFHNDSLNKIRYSYTTDVDEIYFHQKFAEFLNMSIVSYLALLKVYVLAKKIILHKLLFSLILKIF